MAVGAFIQVNEVERLHGQQFSGQGSNEKKYETVIDLYLSTI